MTDRGPAWRSIVASFDPRDNAITPLRLGLAMLVVYSHAYVAGGFGVDPLYDATDGQMTLGTVAVISFFGLSGFLLGRSRAGNSFGSYLRNRVLRIVPGLWVCLAVVALVFVPIAVTLGGRATPEEVVHFVTSAGTFQPLPVVIVGLYPGTGAPSWADAPLWTLPPELYCYLGLGAIGLGSLRLSGAVLAGLLLVFMAANIAVHGQSLVWHLPVAFLVGTLLWHHAGRVPLSAVAAAGMLALTGCSAAFGALPVVAPVTLPYVALWLGLALPVQWARDLSYGTYIYAWPVQQILAEAGVATAGFLPYFVLSLAPILVIAYASARLVEEPMLRLRRRAPFNAASFKPVPAGQARTHPAYPDACTPVLPPPPVASVSACAVVIGGARAGSIGEGMAATPTPTSPPL